jgi:hypothetical protein
MEKQDWFALGILVVIFGLILAVTLLDRQRFEGCPEDLRICPDGISVSRVPPQCDFAACAGEEFMACAGAGNPVLETYPRQCAWPDGRVVVEAVPDR